MRGQTLATLRTQLKAELRDTQEVNSTLDVEYNYSLIKAQNQLTADYDWTYLNSRWDLSLPITTRYATLPTSDIRGRAATINFNRPVEVARRFDISPNRFWVGIDYGIGTKEYNARNSDLGVIADPIQKWQFATNISESTNPNQIEVWPVPASNQTIRFTGQRDVLAVVDDNDPFDLDDLLIVYFVAADYLAYRGQSNAVVVQRKAQEILARLRGGYPVDSEPIVLGRKRTYQKENVKIIAVA